MALDHNVERAHVAGTELAVSRVGLGTWETPLDGAIRDGNLVSGFAWPAHPQFLALFLEVLGTRLSL
jgi:putative intracellular protease/amidase